MAKKKQSSAKKHVKSNKHASKAAKNKRHTFVAEVDSGLLVLFGVVAASAFVAFAPFVLGI